MQAAACCWRCAQRGTTGRALLIEAILVAMRQDPFADLPNQVDFVEADGDA